MATVRMFGIGCTAHDHCSIAEISVRPSTEGKLARPTISVLNGRKIIKGNGTRPMRKPAGENLSTGAALLRLRRPMDTATALVPRQPWRAPQRSARTTQIDA